MFFLFGIILTLFPLACFIYLVAMDNQQANGFFPDDCDNLLDCKGKIHESLNDFFSKMG